MELTADIAGLVLDDKEQGIFRVHRSTFTDPTVFELEKKMIFDRSWLFAGHDSEVKASGDFITRRVGGRPMIIVRGADDEVRVLLNTCRHRGNLVCRDASGHSDVLRCFYHGWVYGTNGELLGVPGADSYSDAFDMSALGLEPPPRVENHRGLLFVSFWHEIEPLADYLGDALAVLDNTLDYGQDLEIVGGTQAYSMRANWKLLVENSMDGYHAMTAHERYFGQFMVDMDVLDEETAAKVLSAGGAWMEGMPQVRALGNGHATTAYPMTRTGERPVTNILPTLAGEHQLDDHLDKLRARFSEEKALTVEGGSGNVLYFPNLITIDNWRTFRTFYPISPGYMEINSWALLPKEDSASLRAARLDNFISFLGPGGFGTPDDVEALEGCQMAFATNREVEWSDISRGMKNEHPTLNDELQMRAFWREWVARLTTGGHAEDTNDASQS
jgi:p-cumate 2,3-dioxygenase alpha subunit